jgi:CheY-like chemotaxis protein
VIRKVLLRRVLLIEDELPLRRLAQAALAGLARWEVESCATGEEGLAAARRDPPDVVLLDVQLPGMDGPATLSALRREPGLERVPVIFLTATSEADELERLSGLGAAGVLRKPFAPLSLHREVQAIVDAWALGTAG